MNVVPSATRHATWRSLAKVNLCLRVVGRRVDGYHLLDSVFAPIALHDELTVHADAIAPGVPTRIEVRCDHAGVPEDASNLAARAAATLLAERGLGGVLRITIAKKIPPGSGLGGGSGNAATILHELNGWLGIGVAPSRLAELALALGADVPFFLIGAPARVRGIGERVEPIATIHALPLVVAIPPVAVSTAWAFRAYADLVPSPCAAGDEPTRLAAGTPPTQALLVNDLERVVLPAFPAIAETKRRLLESGAEAAVMSGSGSAVIGLASSPADARRLAGAVRAALPEVAVYALAIHAPGSDAHRAVDRPAGPA